MASMPVMSNKVKLLDYTKAGVELKTVCPTQYVRLMQKQLALSVETDFALQYSVQSGLADAAVASLIKSPQS